MRKRPHLTPQFKKFTTSITKAVPSISETEKNYLTTSSQTPLQL